jgi:hypothetical protein
MATATSGKGGDYVLPQVRRVTQGPVEVVAVETVLKRHDLQRHGRGKQAGRKRHAAGQGARRQLAQDGQHPVPPVLQGGRQ